MFLGFAYKYAESDNFIDKESILDPLFTKRFLFQIKALDKGTDDIILLLDSQ